MIRRVTIRRFKRFKEVTFRLPGHLVLAGPNNAGKTTVLQAIAAWGLALKRWRELNDFRKHGKAYQRAPLAKQAFSAVPLRVFDLLWHERSMLTPIEIELESSDGWTIAMELSRDSTEQIYVRPTGTALPEVVRDTTLTPVFVPAMTGLGTSEPAYRGPKIEQLLGQGKPGDVLRNLLVQARDSEEAWRPLSDSIERLFHYKIHRPDDSGADIVAEYSPLKGEPRLDIASAGSGFQQVLMLLTFLHTRPGAVLLLDEPDAHLHIILQEVIYSELRKVAVARRSQLIIATHSEVIIDSVEPRELCMLVNDVPKMLSTKEEREGLRSALRVLPQTDVLLAMETPGVLYLEDDGSDLKILREWARILKHPAYETLTTLAFCRKSVWEPRPGSDGIRAHEHYKALKLVRPDLPGVELIDRDNKSEILDEKRAASGLLRLAWRRYEIESYLVHPVALDRFIEETVGAGAASAQNRADAKTYLEEQLPRGVLSDPLGDHAMLKSMKASVDLLPYVLQKAGIDNLEKPDFYQIAAVMLPGEIHPEVTQKLNRIQQEFGLQVKA